MRRPIGYILKRMRSLPTTFESKHRNVYSCSEKRQELIIRYIIKQEVSSSRHRFNLNNSKWHTQRNLTFWFDLTLSKQYCAFVYSFRVFWIISDPLDELIVCASSGKLSGSKRNFWQSWPWSIPNSKYH